MLHETALHQGESTPFSGSKPDFSGKWINQMASTMDLMITGSDVIGKYQSSSSATKLDGDKIEGVLKGYVAGDLISFTVLWPGGSITAWVGQLVDDQTSPRIKTLKARSRRAGPCWLGLRDSPGEHQYAAKENAVRDHHGGDLAVLM